MNIKILKAAVAGFVLSVSGLANAGLIGINFTTDSTPDSVLSANQSAGFVAQTNWNNLLTQTVHNGSQTNLVDSNSDLLSGLNVAWSNVNNDYRGSYSAGTGDDTLFEGMIEGSSSAGVAGPTLNVTGINYAMYDVYVYMAEFASSGASVKIGSEEFFYTATNNFANTGYVQATSTSFHDLSVATYARFSGLTDSSFQIDAFKVNGNRAALVGFQIVEAAQVTDTAQVPEPSTLAIFALGIMGLASRRFKK